VLRREVAILRRANTRPSLDVGVLVGGVVVHDQVQFSRLAGVTLLRKARNFWLRCRGLTAAVTFAVPISSAANWVEVPCRR